MKTKLILLLLLLTPLLYSCESIFGEDEPELPPATKSGKETVGFKVNGKIWANYSDSGILDFSSMNVFSHITKYGKTYYYYVGAFNDRWKNSDNSNSSKCNWNSHMKIYAELDSTFKIFQLSAVFSECNNDSLQTEFNATLYPEGQGKNNFIVTRLDTVGHEIIFSGKFSGTFTANTGRSIEITSGRFDVRFNNRWPE